MPDKYTTDLAVMHVALNTVTMPSTPSRSSKSRTLGVRRGGGAERNRRRLDAVVRCCAGLETRTYGQSRGVMPFSCAYVAADASTMDRTNA